MTKFHRITRLNLRQGMQGILTETANGLVTGFVAIPAVNFHVLPRLGLSRCFMRPYIHTLSSFPVILEIKADNSFPNSSGRASLSILVSTTTDGILNFSDGSYIGQ